MEEEVSSKFSVIIALSLDISHENVEVLVKMLRRRLIMFKMNM